MKIIKIKKNYFKGLKTIEVTIKGIFNCRVRSAYRYNVLNSHSWKWCDTDKLVMRDELLEQFYQSDCEEFVFTDRKV